MIEKSGSKCCRAHCTIHIALSVGRTHSNWQQQTLRIAHASDKIPAEAAPCDWLMKAHDQMMCLLQLDVARDTEGVVKQHEYRRRLAAAFERQGKLVEAAALLEDLLSDECLAESDPVRLQLLCRLADLQVQLLLCICSAALAICLVR